MIDMFVLVRVIESYQCFNPCQNNATCSYSAENGSKCLCESGFQGVHCEGQPAAYVVNNILIVDLALLHLHISGRLKNVCVTFLRMRESVVFS